MQIVLILLYLFLIIINYRSYKRRNNSLFLAIITIALLIFFLSGSNHASLDWSETELDLSGYRTIYEIYDALEHPDFNMYYIFYSSMYIGQNLGLPFGTWWFIMSILAMFVIVGACAIHKYSINLFLAGFMAYYIFMMYSGLKFFYGFCFLLMAYGFLLRNTRKGQILFGLFTCLAGGLHMMYYLYLILLIKPIHRPKLFINVIITITIIFTILMRISGTAASFLAPFFNILDNDRINIYTVFNVNMGFYIPVILHLIMVYTVYRVRKYKIKTASCNPMVDTLFYSSILSLIFIPFYALALTFMRLITAFSLVVITANSSVTDETMESRMISLKMSLLMAGSFFFMKLLAGAESFLNSSVIPFFDVL